MRTLEDLNLFYGVDKKFKTNKEWLLVRINPDEKGFDVYSKSNQLTPLMKQKKQYLEIFPNAEMIIVKNN